MSEVSEITDKTDSVIEVLRMSFYPENDSGRA